MPEIADPPSVCCSLLHSGTGTEEVQALAPDLFRSRAPARVRAREADLGMRDKSGHFATGHSGNPQGRPRGIPNPQRRVLTLAAYRHNPQAAAALLDRKPRLLRPLLVQLLPQRARPLDPAERLGISVEALHNAADMQQAMQQVLAAVSAGEIGIREAGRIARQVRTRMRALRRLARLRRRVARLASAAQGRNGIGRGESAE
jgi:hypothetical protein